MSELYYIKGASTKYFHYVEWILAVKACVCVWVGGGGRGGVE